MSDVTGADRGPDLSIAYRALERRRDEAIAQRDRITDELKKLDAVLEALRALAGIAPEPASANSQEAASPASEVAQAATTAMTKEASGPAPRTAKAADRKVRIIEFLLEHPRQWFTSAEIGGLTEEGGLSVSQRNAVSETLRRLLRRGCVERDETTRPVRYRAISPALREVLLAEQ